MMYYILNITIPKKTTEKYENKIKFPFEYTTDSLYCFASECSESEHSQRVPTHAVHGN